MWWRHVRERTEFDALFAGWHNTRVRCDPAWVWSAHGACAEFTKSYARHRKSADRCTFLPCQAGRQHQQQMVCTQLHVRGQSLSELFIRFGLCDVHWCSSQALQCHAIGTFVSLGRCLFDRWCPFDLQIDDFRVDWNQYFSLLLITGICAKAARVPTRHHHLFSYLSYRNPCELKGMLTKHNLSASDMRRAYEFVTNATVNCPQPNKYTKVRLAKSKAKNCNW